MPKTRFFQSCLGVFQGGGCRAASLAGAYAAAVESGVHFAEVAGTSAGSIVAVLVGAGASPEFMWEKLRNLEFEKFLQAPERGRPSLNWVTRGIISLKSRELASIFKHGGLYSSSYIEVWIDEVLSELLPESKRPIRFRDLVRPTFVVASDINGTRPRVWSSADTPEEFVSTAVRASCSIPFFFQPVEHGGNKYVDGGVLSNLPLFVFDPKDGIRRPRSNRILAFRLKGDYESPNTSDLFAFTKALTSVVVDGAAELQCKFHRDLQEITIPTGNVTATDFQRLADDKSGEIVQELYVKGRDQTRRFMQEELINLRAPQGTVVECQDEDAYYFEIIELGERNPAEIIVVSADSRWVWDLFPAMIQWINRGISLRVLISDTNEGPAGKQRRELLGHICPNVVSTNKVPFEGFLFRNSLYGDFSAVIMRASDEEAGATAARYCGALHKAAVSALFNSIDQQLGSTNAQSSPSLVAVSTEQYFENLKKGVSQYASSNFSFEKIRVRDLLLSAGDIREYKYRQIVSFAELYKQYQLTLFGPVQVSIGELNSLVTPPVVELSGSRRVIIQGNTRAAFCYLNGIDELDCIIVRDVNAPLPIQPVEIRRMRVVTQRTSPKLNYDLFRKIERAIRPYG